MCHAGAVSPYQITPASPSSSFFLLLPRPCAWLGMAGCPCTCLPLRNGKGTGGGRCMVCSENYFSTATRLIHGGALSISRHLADLVVVRY